jgi:hypothetical protein
MAKGPCQYKKVPYLDRRRLERTEVLVSHRKPQPGKIGTKLWAIFDRAEDNSVSQRRNENGEVMTFPTRQHVRAYLKQTAAQRLQ